MQTRETGLPAVIHISCKGGSKRVARVKVSNIAGRYAYNDSFSITLEHAPRVIGKCKIHNKHLAQIIDWVNLNKEHLHKVWNDDSMDNDEVSVGFKHSK